MTRNLKRFLSCVLTASLLGFAFYQAAYAGPIATEQVASQSQAAGERERVKAMLDRPELAKQLQAMGIPSGNAEARVDAMTDQEVHMLAGKLEGLPAGGDISNTGLIEILLLIVILVLVI